METTFYEKLKQEKAANEEKGKKGRSIISQQTVNEYIRILLRNNEEKKNPKVYYLYKYYSIINDDDGNPQLVRKCNNNKFLIMVSYENLFRVIHDAHINCGHGKKQRLYYHLKCVLGYANITHFHIQTYLSLCLNCIKKGVRGHASSPLQPIISRGFGERGQVDLIDMSSFKTSRARYILNYQDHTTKFCILKPLLNKDTNTVLNLLIEIFTLFGCPKVLQCDNGYEFKCCTDLKKIWSNLKIIHSRPRHPQSQGSVERANGDIEQMLRCWVNDNNCIDWERGLPFVQFQKNLAFNRTIKCCPYIAVFGQYPPVNHTVFKNKNNNNDEFISFNNDQAEGSTTEQINSSSDDDNDNSSEDDTMENFKILEINNNDFNVADKCKKIKEIRQTAIEGIVTTAEKVIIKNKSSSIAKIYKPGDLINIHIPREDRFHKLGFSNILCRIEEYYPETDRYKVKSVKTGITINKLITPSQINDNVVICIEADNIPPPSFSSSIPSQSMSLRSVAKMETADLVGCACINNCLTRKCLCIKLSRKCIVDMCHRKRKLICQNLPSNCKKT